MPHLAHEVERPPDWHVGSPPGWRPGPCNERCPSLPSQLQAKLDAVFREPSPDPLLPEEGLIREPVTANAQSSANVSTHSAASYSTPPRTGSRALSCSSHGHAGHAPFAPCPGQVALDPGPWQIPRWPQAEPPQPAQTGHSPSRSLPAMSTAPVTEPMLEAPWACLCHQHTSSSSSDGCRIFDPTQAHKIKAAAFRLASHAIPRGITRNRSRNIQAGVVEPLLKKFVFTHRP